MFEQATILMHGNASLAVSKQIYIGCSGYYYSYWKNRFYPEGLKPKDWLGYYCTIFNTVELNGTFYRTPQLAALKRYAEQTPGDFRFAVKVSKYITHTLKLKESAQSTLEFQDLVNRGLGDKLQHFLFQLPPSFHYSEENLERILTQIPNYPRNVVELRHASWWNADVATAFRKAGLTFCNVDFPGMQSYFIHTSTCFYLRLHGNPILFKSSYSLETLSAFRENMPEANGQQSVYFNNTYYEAGYTNALEFKAILNSRRLVGGALSFLS